MFFNFHKVVPLFTVLLILTGCDAKVTVDNPIDEYTSTPEPQPKTERITSLTEIGMNCPGTSAADWFMNDGATLTFTYTPSTYNSEKLTNVEIVISIDDADDNDSDQKIVSYSQWLPSETKTVTGLGLGNNFDVMVTGTANRGINDVEISLEGKYRGGDNSFFK